MSEKNTKRIVVKSQSKTREINIEYCPKSMPKYIPWFIYQDKTSEYDCILEAIKHNKARGQHVTIVFFLATPGTGKTVMGYNLARDLGNAPIQIINCSAQMGVDTLLGMKSSDGSSSGLIYEYGPAAAIGIATDDENNKSGFGVLNLNEFNVLRPEVQIALNSLMDGQDKLILPDNNNEVIKIEKNHLVIIASGNPGFLGTNTIQESVRDRISVFLELIIPDVDREVEVLQTLTKISEINAKKVAKFANQWRKAHHIDNNVSLSPSPRSMINFIEHAKFWGAKKAFELTMNYKFSETKEEREFIAQICKNHTMNTWNLQSVSATKKDEVKTTRKKATRKGKSGTRRKLADVEAQIRGV
jgi:hypothetical protein